jgi:hypothetical protein
MRLTEQGVNIRQVLCTKLRDLARVAIISILPVETVSNTDLEADLKKRLNSKLFSVEHISILTDQEEKAISTQLPK